jgi:hypothetical protein
MKINRAKCRWTRSIHLDVKTSEFENQGLGGHFFHSRLNALHILFTSSFGKPHTERRVPLLEAADVL